MTPLEWVRVIVAWAALAAAVLAFVNYMLLSAAQSQRATSTAQKVDGALDNAKTVAFAPKGDVNSTATGLTSASDLAEFVKALATLGEVMVKAGPALWSMLGSAVFLLVAAAAAGAFQAPAAPSAQAVPGGAAGQGANGASQGRRDAGPGGLNENEPVR